MTYPFPAEALSSISTAEILLLIIQLPVGYRTVFNLHVIEGYAHREVAEMLGIQEATSRSQLAKAKLLLQKMILKKSTRSWKPTIKIAGGEFEPNSISLARFQGKPRFNTNAAWNKLSVRLEAKPIHRKPAFYWAAAAILFMLFSAGWFILQKPNEKKLVHSPSKINPSNKFLPSGTTLAKPNDNKTEETMVFYPQVISSPKTSTFVPAKKKKRVPVESPSLVAINSQAEPKIEIQSTP
jgi:hypothetical protein